MPVSVMLVNIYIDNNVWDFLFDRQMDLAIELPRDEFCVCITREAEFEIPPMPPEPCHRKKELSSRRR